MRTARDKSNGPSCARRLSQRGDASMRWRDCARKNVKSEMRRRCIGGEEKLVVERDGG